MNHRTYGETENCKGCRFWSEMIARSQGDGVAAMCINSEGSESGKYKFGSDKCESWKSGHYGAVDSPGESSEIIQMYKEEEN
jgi:hypothetical protein